MMPTVKAAVGFGHVVLCEKAGTLLMFLF